MITQETTARLLFMAVRWVRCLPPFQTISKDDQLLLLERSWTQLFLLHLAQWSVSWDITALLEDEQVRARLPTDDNPTNQELVLIQVYGSSCSFLKSIICVFTVYFFRSFSRARNTDARAICIFFCCWSVHELEFVSAIYTWRNYVDLILQAIICRFRQLSPDFGECGCMKAVALFTPGKRDRNLI